MERFPGDPQHSLVMSAIYSLRMAAGFISSGLASGDTAHTGGCACSSVACHAGHIRGFSLIAEKIDVPGAGICSFLPSLVTVTGYFKLRGEV